MRKAKVVLVLVCVVAMTLTACGSWESDVLAVLGVANVAVQSIAPIVEIADPALAAGVQIAVKVWGASESSLSSLITSFETNPGGTTVQQIDQSVASLQQSTDSLVNAAQIKDPTKEAEVEGIIGGVLTAVTEIANAVPQAASGTSVAELYIEGWRVEVTDAMDPIPAPKSAKPGTRVIHSARYWKSHFKKLYSAPSSNPKISAVKKQWAAKL